VGKKDRRISIFNADVQRISILLGKNWKSDLVLITKRLFQRTLKDLDLDLKTVDALAHESPKAVFKALGFGSNRTTRELSSSSALFATSWDLQPYNPEENLDVYQNLKKSNPQGLLGS